MGYDLAKIVVGLVGFFKGSVSHLYLNNVSPASGELEFLLS